MMIAATRAATRATARPFATALAFVATVMLSVPAAWAEDPRAAALIDLNRAVLEQLILENDPTLLDQVTHDAFVVVAPGGLVERKSEAKRGATSFDVQALDLGEEQVIFTGSTAVLVGRLELDGVMHPVGRLGPMKFMAVFVEEEGEWKLLARSLTRCLEAAIERGFC